MIRRVRPSPVTAALASALARLIADPDAEHGHAGARGEADEACPQRALGQRDQAIEERQQPDGGDQGQQHRRGEEGQRAQQPPPGGEPQERVRELRARQGEGAADRGRLHGVPGPAPEGLVKQAEAARKPEGAEPGQRQGEQAPAGGEGGQDDGELQPGARRPCRGRVGETTGGARRE